jgi:hypothetical protein
VRLRVGDDSIFPSSSTSARTMLAIATKGWPDLTAFWQTQANSPGQKSAIFPIEHRRSFLRDTAQICLPRWRVAILMLKALSIVYREERAVGSYYSLVLRLLAALRFVFFPNRMLQFHSMKITRKLYNPTRRHDPLYFIVHTHYISKYFGLRQRVQAALNHHEYELNTYSSEYARRVYRSDGVLLWERSVNNRHFTIVLIATEDKDNRLEGDLSVILSVDNIRLSIMSFCYLNASVFGLRSHMTMLISRNQTDRTPGRDLFNQCFKQNTPQLFCLSAVCGIAMANEFETVLAIKHDAQLCYDKTFDLGFRNSYTALWEKFDAVEIDPHVYKLDVPLKLRPLEMVNRVHRARARDRRMHWDDIVQSARSRMINYRMAFQVRTDARSRPAQGRFA